MYQLGKKLRFVCVVSAGLFFSPAAFAGPLVIQCSCDVNDQIDVQEPIKAEANKNSWKWTAGQLIILQNATHWRAYKYGGVMSGLFIIQIAGGEGEYSAETANGLYSVGIDGDGGEQGQVFSFGDYLFEQQFGGGLQISVLGITVLEGRSDNWCGPGTPYICVSNSFGAP